MEKFNFSSLISTISGTIEKFDGLSDIKDNKHELQSVSIGSDCISNLKKIDNEYYFSCDNVLYGMQSIDGERQLKHFTEYKIVDYYKLSADKILVLHPKSLCIYADEENEQILLELNGDDDSFQTMLVLEDGKRVAVAGCNCELTVIQLDDGTVTFKGKTPSANPGLGSAPKIHIKCLARDLSNPDIIFCGTAFKAIQKYDVVGKQRKPVKIANLPWGGSVSSLLTTESGIVVASNFGELGLLDFSQVSVKGHCHNFRRFSGSSNGSVSGISIASSVYHGDTRRKSKDLLVVCTLDRSFRVFDMDEKKLLIKIFMNRQPTAVIVDSINVAEEDDLLDELDRIENEESTIEKQMSMEDVQETDQQKEEVQDGDVKVVKKNRKRKIIAE